MKAEQNGNLLVWPKPHDDGVLRQGGTLTAPESLVGAGRWCSN